MFWRRKPHVHDFVPLAKANNKIYLDCVCGRRKVTDRDHFAAQEVTYPESVYFADKCLIDASTIAVPSTLK